MLSCCRCKFTGSKKRIVPSPNHDRVVQIRRTRSCCHRRNLLYFSFIYYYYFLFFWPPTNGLRFMYYHEMIIFRPPVHTTASRRLYFVYEDTYNNKKYIRFTRCSHYARFKEPEYGR